MTELLPVVLRGILPDNVRLTIVKLCTFLNAVSQKIIDPENLIKLQNDVVQWLVGYIEEICELDYGPNFKVPLFRCQWVKLSGGGVTKDEYGIVAAPSKLNRLKCTNHHLNT